MMKSWDEDLGEDWLEWATGVDQQKEEKIGKQNEEEETEEEIAEPRRGLIKTDFDMEDTDWRMDEEADEEDEIAWKLMNGKEWVYF